jgi:hypothetical protein
MWGKLYKNFTMLYLWTGKIKDNRYWEFQMNWFFNPLLELKFNLDLNQNDYRNFTFSIFGLIRLELTNNLECDHEGFTSGLNILGFDFYLSNVDTRHWDYDNETYVK